MIDGAFHKTKSQNKDFVFSILIPSWNNLPYLQNAIESIRTHSTYKHQIVVHINEGKDGSLEWVQQQPDIDYTYSKTNIGLCCALNAGRQLVSTEYIVYINDDMYVLPEWDAYFLNEIKSIGHNMFFLNGTAIEPYAGNPCIIHKDYGTDIHSFQKEKLLREFASFNKPDFQGASWCPNILHVSIWDIIGGYSIEFSPAHYSDPDIGMKLWMAGIRIFKGLGQCRVYHFGSKSTGRFKKPLGYYRFIAKWGMTAKVFTKYYLKMGQPYDGILPEPKVGTFIKIKNFIKKLVALTKL